MTWWQSIILGIVEGVTEFLPVSSTGHLTVTEKLMGMQLAGNDALTAYTAIIQVGAILASVIYFWKDIVRLATAWFRGLAHAEARQEPDYRLGWAVIVGSIPVGIVGFLARHLITGPLRSLWVVAAGLALWSIVMFLADRTGSADKGEHDVTWVDGLIIGLVQCLALVPGVSRSGATISAGLFRRFDRVTATRLSFFLGIPALVASGGFEAATEAGNISAGFGWPVTVIGLVVSFVVAYASIAWLLRFVSSNRFTGFVVYRVIAAVAIIGLILAGVVGAA